MLTWPARDLCRRNFHHLLLSMKKLTAVALQWNVDRRACQKLQKRWASASAAVAVVVLGGHL